MKIVLETLVEKLVLEVLRGFNLNKFKTLTTIDQRISYAHSILPKLGKGSSRVVFALSGDKALKIARSQAGVAQNTAELELFTSPQTKPVVAKIYDAASDNTWLISELIKPFARNRQEWQEATGFDYLNFAELVKLWEKEKEPPVQEFMENLVRVWQQKVIRFAGQEHSPIYKVTQARLRNYIRMSKSPLIHGLFGLLKQGLLRADVANIDADNTSNNVIGHFGKTLDGRVVLLDYGYTEEVWDKHYRAAQEAAEAEEEGAEQFSSVPVSVPDDFEQPEQQPPENKQNQPLPKGSIPPKKPKVPSEEDEEPMFVSTGRSLK